MPLQVWTLAARAGAQDVGAAEVGAGSKPPQGLVASGVTGGPPMFSSAAFSLVSLSSASAAPRVSSVAWCAICGAACDGTERFQLKKATLDNRPDHGNQERELRDVVARMGCEVVRVYKDHGISGRQGPRQAPGLRRNVSRFAGSRILSPHASAPHTHAPC
jgi:hypothetical protein